MADFTDLIQEQKIANQKQDRVIALLESGDSPQSLKRASADEVQAEYDVLKLGQVFQIAYDKLTGMSLIDDKIQEQTARDAEAYDTTNDLLTQQNDFFERLNSSNEEQNKILNKIGATLFIGLELDKKLEKVTNSQLLLAGKQFNYEKKQDDEDEREDVLGKGEDGAGKVSGKDLTGGSFSKTFKGLKALLGGVTLFFGGLLLTVKALQNEMFRGAVGDLFRVIGDVFNKLIIPAGEALLPIATKILEYTVKGLTLFFDSVLTVFGYLKDFNENAAINPEDYKGVITGPGAFMLPTFLKRIRDAVKGSTPALKTVESIEDTSTGIRGAFMRISSGIKKILAPIGRVADVLTKTVAPLAKLPLISTVTNFFGGAGAKAGGFLKFLGKLFLPFTIIIGLVDTVKGFYAGFFGTDLEEGEEPPEGFINQLMAGLEGGVKGLVNSLVGAPLDFLKGAVGWVLGKMGFTGAEEALASFRFSDVIADILSIIFNPIDSITDLFRRIFDFDIIGWLTKNVPYFDKIVDFFTTDDVEAQMQTIRQNRNKENQIERLQKRLDEAQAKLDDPDFSGNRTYLESQVAMRQSQIDEIRAATGLSIEGLPARIEELQTMADAVEGGDREKLLQRIAELEQLQTELEKQNVIVVNTDNKQTQVNNTNGTVSVGKETTPNDQTFKTLQLQYGIP